MRSNSFFSAALALASACLVSATDPLTADKVEADITTTEIQRVLWNLNKIARDNGGTRAFGTPGYKASVDFVLERAQTRFYKQMDTYLQSFTYVFEDLHQIKVTGPEGEDVIVVSPEFNNPGDVSGSLIDTPVDDVVGSGCEPEQWEGIDATGKIALVKRGICAVSQKLLLARAHGALGVVLWNNVAGNDIVKPTLGADNLGTLVPVGIIPMEVGAGWKARLAAGEDLVVSLLVDSTIDDRETWNVISETKEGDPSKVIMLGAHLDSVIEGPGINDDGSGTAALLELMGSVKKYKGFPHKIRFAWWAAEESGLVGSYHYTEGLNATEADAIKFYFNYDMIGSPNPIYELGRYENSGIGPDLLAEYLEAQGKPVTWTEFDDRSDYAGFIELGIPTASIFTGEDEHDPCYHQACDNLDNINWDAITVNTKAAGRALATLANSLDGIPARAPPAAEKRSPATRGAASRRKHVRAAAAGVKKKGHRTEV